jgi:nucleotide-binding universal stress UspA family protein
MFNRILVTVGLSTNTWSAIPFVRHLALMFNAELHLLGLSTEPQQVWDSTLMAYMENISLNLEDANIRIYTNFVYGNPAVEVVRYSEKKSIDLVATVAGSNNEISCSILNSIAKRMGIKADIPVLIVPGSRSKESDLTEKIDFAKILVPLDCSEVGEAVLPYIATVAKKTGGSVTLLHVNTPPIRGVPVMHHEVVGMSRWVGKEYLKKECSRLQGQGIKSNFEVIDGTPVKTIVKYAHQNKVDLIAIGARSASGIANWIFGNVANKVSERTTTPILSVSYPAFRAIEYPIPEYVLSIDGEGKIPNLKSGILKP